MSSKRTELPEAVEVKTEPGIRLSSFRPPRDLSLANSISKPPPKKVFTPNLNVTRNKNKHLLIEDTKKDRRKDKQNGRDGRDKKGKPSKTPTIIKSSGVFSDGMAASTNHRGRDREDYQLRSQALPKPVFKKQQKVEKEFQQMKIKEHSSDEDDADEQNDAQFLPIRLPMDIDEGGYLFRPDIKAKAHIKQEPIVKTEPIDTNVLAEAAVASDTEDCKDSLSLFKNSNDSMFLLQFPDTLPGRGPDRQEKPNTSEEKSTETNMEGTCKFEDLEEGKIGKIVMYKSGKVQLHMGNARFDLTMGSQTSFREDVMSISTNAEDRTGTMINLGPVTTKIMAIPDWEHLLKESGLS